MSRLRQKSRSKKKRPYLKVYRLILDPDIYRFDTSFPDFIEDRKDARIKLLEKIWFIKKQIRYQTQFDTPIEPITSYVHPEGFCAFPPLIGSRMLSNVYDDLKRLYRNVLRTRPKEVLISNQKAARGLIYLFTGDKGANQTYMSSMIYLAEHGYTRLTNTIEKYTMFICELYNIPYTEEFLNEHMQIGLLRYDKQKGIWLHIDNVERTDQGPIITISIGPPLVYYDMTPAILPNSKAYPLRFVSTEGSILIMDGSSRMEWAHGLPEGVPDVNGKQKYTIMFKCDRFRKLDPVYNRVLDHTLTTSGKVC